MANNIGTLVIAPVRPQSTEDTYPVAYASELCGGYYQVSSLVEMYAIPAERRIEGLICWVTDTQKSYRLVGGIDNSNWQELVIDISSTGYTDAQAQAAVGSLLTSSGTFYFEYVPLGYIAGHVKLATSGGLAITSTGIFLEDVPITPGMYTKVVVNSRGQVIEGYLLTESDLPFHTHDDRYYTESEIEDKFTSTGSYYSTIFSSTGHLHDDRYYTEVEVDTKFTSTGNYYTSIFSSTGHLHDDRYYTEVEVDSKFTSTGNYYAAHFSSTGHIHDDRYYTESEVDSKFTSTGAYYSSVFFGHTHDDRYYTKEISDTRFSSTGHTHDDRYYTESEIDDKFTSTGVYYQTIFSPTEHTHDDRYYTESEIETKFSSTGSYYSTIFSSTGHLHDDRYLQDITNESIGDLKDVDLTGLAHNNILKYNSTSGHWEVSTSGGGGETYTAGAGLQLVGIEFSVKPDGSTIIVTSSGVKVADNTFATLLHNHNLSDLSDVDNSQRDNGKLLVWNTSTGKHVYIAAGSGSGDMLRAVYDPNDDGVVDVATYATSSGYLEGKRASDFASSTHAHDDRYYTQVEVDGKFTSTGSYYQTIFSSTGHTHDSRYYTQSEIDNKFTSTGVYYTGVFSSTGHIHDDRYYTEVESDNRFSSTGHIHDDRYYTEIEADSRFSASSHTHDDRYYTETEVDDKFTSTGAYYQAIFSSTGHTHDDRYYTEVEIDNKFTSTGSYYQSIFSSTGHIHDHASLTNVGTYTHLQIDSHITSTGHLTTTQKSELVGGGETSLHTHDIRYYTKTEIDGKISSTGHTHDGRYVRRDIYDWYLPTKEELELIYTNLAESELVEFTNGVYSSSTEYDDSNIWSVHFGSGYVSTTPKSDYYYVRACRTFLIAEDEPSLPIGYLTSTGGYIFYVVASGKGTCTYYEVTSQDIDSNNPWSNIQDVEIGSDAQYTAVGFGAQNTQAIISQSGHLFSNAYTCVCYPKSGVSHSSLYNLDRDDHFQYSRIDGSRPFINDIDIQGIKVGAGGGGDSTNTRIGANALDSNLSGTYNTAAGISSLQLLQSGSENAAVGVGALGNLQLGGYNTAIGGGALNLLGYEHETESVNYNTAIGYSAGSSLRNGQNVTCIGYDSQPSSTGAINEITLGNEYVTLVRTFGQIETKIATGTPPFKVSSATLVTNLNVDLLDGKHASEFSSTGHTHADLHSPYTLGTKTIDETNINNNYYIKYDTSSDTLVYSPISGGSLSTLTDVQLDSLSNNQILVYDSTSEKWINSNYTPSSSSTGIVHEALLTSVEGVYSYNLGFIPTDKKNLLVLVNGQAAHPDDYTISEDILTFSTEPLLGGDVIIIKEIGSGYVYETTSSTTSYVLTSSGETVTSQEYSFYAQSSVLTYYLPFGVNQKEDLLIFNGTTLVPYEKYDVSGNVLTFVSGYLTTGALIQLRTLISRQDVTLTSAGYYILSPSDYSITTTSESYVDNKCYIYLTFVPLRKEAIVVTVNGVVLHPDDYSLDSNLVIIAEGVTEVSDVVVVKVVFPSVGLTINEISPDLEQPIQLYHDGTDGHILCSTGDLWIDTVNTSTGQITDGCIRSHGKIYNAVWNDFADFWNVKPGVQAIPGFCYADYGEGLEAPRSKGDSAVIGIYSDTYGYGMGERAGAIPIAVSGFCLAYVDRQYPSGTLLTNDTDGMLRKASLFDILFKRVVAKYIRPECAEYFNGAVKVNGRHWVKVI